MVARLTFTGQLDLAADDGPPFEGTLPPPDVPPDPTGHDWRGLPGADGPPGPAGAAGATGAAGLPGLAGVDGADGNWTAPPVSAINPSNLQIIDGTLGVLGSGGVTSESITSGATDTTADVAVTITRITSGGTAGNENVVLPDFAYTVPAASPVAASEKNGTRHIFILDVQTDPADVVLAFAGSVGTDAVMLDTANNVLARISGGVRLDYPGAAATFVWWDTGWQFEIGNYDNSSDLTGTAFYVPSLAAASPNVSLYLTGTNTGSPSDAPLWTTAPMPGSISFLQTGAAPLTIDYNQYSVLLTTGGTGGTESVILPAPGVALQGTRQVIALDTITAPSDVVSFDVSNIQDIAGGALTSITMDTADQYLLLEVWDAATYRVLRGTATVT